MSFAERAGRFTLSLICTIPFYALMSFLVEVIAGVELSGWATIGIYLVCGTIWTISRTIDEIFGIS